MESYSICGSYKSGFLRCITCHDWYCSGECYSRHFNIHKTACSLTKEGLIWSDGTKFDRPSQAHGTAGKKVKEDAALSPGLPVSDETNRKPAAYAGVETVRHTLASPRKEDLGVEQVSIHQGELASQIDSHDYQLLGSPSGSSSALLELFKSLAPVLVSGAIATTSMARLRTAFTLLHTEAKVNECGDQLVLPTLWSQEGAVKSVKMNFSCEQQCQILRQLWNAHMCCLSFLVGRSQHLAVTVEKGKITVFQLSPPLKQADSAQRKLTLTSLSSAPVPFTVLSLVFNHSNENLLAVCSLKAYHVLIFNSSGDVVQLVMQLGSVYYITKLVWQPGSQAQLAVVTTDTVKIYDLASDALSQAYYFLVPNGKIKDVTFVHTVSGDMFLLLMSSAGHIYFQQLCDGGGVYSHTLQMLFCSYAQGKSLMAPLTQVTEELAAVFPIQVRNWDLYQ